MYWEKNCTLIKLKDIVEPSTKYKYKGLVLEQIIFQFVKIHFAILTRKKLLDDPGGGDCWAIHHKWVFQQPLKVNTAAHQCLTNTATAYFSALLLLAQNCAQLY